MIKDEISGKEIVNARVNKEFKEEFERITKERCLTISKLLRRMLNKFVKDPDAVLEFLRGE